jgi:zinc transport system substrate-binding protein
VAFLAEQIGGDLVSVKTVVPPGVEPHDFDPSLRDVSDMYRSKLVIMNGAGVDRWAERLEGDFTRKGVRVIVLARSTDLLDVTDADGGEGGESGVKDPHFWLDPIAYGKSAEAILQGLIDIDPAHASIYRTNFGRFEREIGILDAHFRSLSGDQCRLDTVIVSHNAFSYLAKRYGFGVRSIAGINPEQEVSAGELATVIRFMKEKNIRFVLDEPRGNAAVATTIRKEISAEVLTLNPIEGIFPDDLARGENYFTVMNANWITLRKALECMERE